MFHNTLKSYTHALSVRSLKIQTVQDSIRYIICGVWRKGTMKETEVCPYSTDMIDAEDHS